MTEQFKLNFNVNNRSNLRADFRDHANKPCEIGEANTDGELRLYLGRSVEMMCLNREQAREIALALLGFATTGRLGESGEDALQILQGVISKIDQKLAAIESLAVDPAPIRQYINQLETERAADRNRIAELEAQLEEARERASELARPG